MTTRGRATTRARKPARPAARKPAGAAAIPREMSVRAYARLRDVSHTAVLNAIRSKRIHRLPSGKIDPVAADRAWAANTDPSKPLNSVCGDPRHRRTAGAPPTPVRGRQPRALGAPAGGERPPEEQRDPPQESRYVLARGTREEIAARRAQILLDELEGRKIDAETARLAIATLQRQLRDQVLKMPYRAGPEIAAIFQADPRPVIAVLLREAREICAGAARATLPGDQSPEEPSADSDTDPMSPSLAPRRG